MKCLLVIFSVIFLFSCNKNDIEPLRTASCNNAVLEEIPFNQFQVIGTHNSYRKKTFQPLFSLLSLASFVLPENLWLPEGSDPAIEWDYDHEVFERQFDDYQVRGLEIDIYNDPNGGLFSDQLGKALVGQPIASGEPTLDEPGLKVLHIPHLDYRTHYLTFKESLIAILNWSNEHPNHFPITVMIELKDFGINFLGAAFDDEAKEAVANELLSVFPKEKLITPADIRTRATLAESVKLDGWPSLAETRGKVCFFVLGEDEILETIFGSNRSLEENDNHIFKTLDNPINDFSLIQEAIAEGFMVRTRADAGTSEARTGDTKRRDMAIESGAQVISTDFVRPDSRYINFPDQWTDYEVQWENDQVAKLIYSNCYVDKKLQ